MDAGWIKIHRKLLDWEWFTEPNVAHFFIYCLLRANHEDIKWKGSEIKRSTFVSSVANMSVESGLSPKQVRNAIKKLTETNELTSQGTSCYTIITICNYDKYQIVEDNEGQTKGEQRANEGQTKGEQRANEGQTKGEQRATNKNEKNEKNEKKEINKERKERKKECDGSEGNLLWLSSYWNTKTFGVFRPIPDLTEAYTERMYYANKLVNHWGKEKIKEAIDKMVASKFLSNGRFATFDWLLGNNPMNIEKVLSGNYDDSFTTNDLQRPMKIYVTPSGMRLGKNEWIENGRRTYGTGKYEVPMDAPARPSEQAWWDNEKHQWNYA